MSSSAFSNIVLLVLSFTSSAVVRSAIGLNLSYRKRKGFYQLHQRIFRAVCTVFVIHFSETKSCTLIYCCVLIIFLPTCYAVAWNKFYIYLYFLSWIRSPLIRLWLVCLPLCYFRVYLFFTTRIKLVYPLFRRLFQSIIISSL